jgi:signal transduction histidine kinase
MPILAERLVWIMNDRVRETTAQDQTRDKLIALGKLSAGLAHELNNPAAAASRTVDELIEMLAELRASDISLCRHDLTTDQRTFLAALEREAIAGGELSNNTTRANALEMSDREDALLTWLETNNVENGWRLAPVLLEAGIDTRKLENLAHKIGGSAIADVLTRLGAQLTVARLASEIKTSVTRISDLVGAIKEYSYMDRTAVGEIDLHRGLDNTLLILKYKLKKKNIRVEREYGENLPLVRAHGSELNLVWTNLIANAIDAMESGGQLKIRTRLEPSDVFIEIRDNGSGILPEIQSRIFEPFFTTKGVNEGTGLGLDTVLRIVRHHHGNLRFESKPGDTCFQIRLPFSSEAQMKDSPGVSLGEEDVDGK